MREYEVDIKGIEKGLRQWKSNARGDEGLLECHCLMPQPGGLIEIDEITSINETNASYLIDENGDYIVDENGDKIII